MAQEVPWKEIANGKLRRLLARNNAREFAAVSPSVLLHMAEMGVVARFQGQTAKVARCCVARRVDPKDVGCAHWGPVSGVRAETDAGPSLMGGRGAVEDPST